MKHFKSNGKLLITGEYLVLDGAKSLALPTQFGQELLIETNSERIIYWESYDENDRIWFKDNFLVEDILENNFTSENDISERLFHILKSVHALNPTLFKSGEGFNIKTKQNFNRTWGLGTSSTLINNISNWANINAYELLKLTFGGSGYDIACAQNNSAISYQLVNEHPNVAKVDFNPEFKEQLYFVYLNQKQNSRDGIANYRKNKSDLTSKISDINAITNQLLTCTSICEFESLITKHELIISKIIKQVPIKESLFSDFKGSIKSLGAWGGDFVMVTSTEDPSSYFISKGFETILPFSKIIKA